MNLPSIKVKSCEGCAYEQSSADEDPCSPCLSQHWDGDGGLPNYVKGKQKEKESPQLCKTCKSWDACGPTGACWNKTVWKQLNRTCLLVTDQDFGCIHHKRKENA